MSAAKIAISLPEGLLSRIEEARQASGKSRSEFIATAVQVFFQGQDSRTESETYAEGYRRMPETGEEIKAADGLATAILATEPWA